MRCAAAAGGRNRAQSTGEARGPRNRRSYCQTAGAQCTCAEQRSADRPLPAAQRRRRRRGGGGGSSSSDKQRRATEHAITRTKDRERAQHYRVLTSPSIISPSFRLAMPLNAIRLVRGNLLVFVDVFETFCTTNFSAWRFTAGAHGRRAPRSRSSWPCPWRRTRPRRSCRFASRC